MKQVLANEINDNGCRRKKTTFFAAGAGRLAPTCEFYETQCPGQTFVQNVSQIRSAVSDEMCPRDTHTYSNSKLNIHLPRHHGGDNNQIRLSLLRLLYLRAKR